MGLKQSITKDEDDIVAVGAPTFGNTSTVEEVTQPFDGFVAVKVYTPAAQAEVVMLVDTPQTFAPAQFTVEFVGVATPPVNVTDEDAQVNV